jgi:hypothetical protein
MVFKSFGGFGFYSFLQKTSVPKNQAGEMLPPRLIRIQRFKAW